MPGETWSGWAAESAIQVELEVWKPWHALVDASEAPFVRWYCGGITNACFNECDRHVLQGHGAEVAFISEADAEDCSVSTAASNRGDRYCGGGGGGDGGVSGSSSSRRDGASTSCADPTFCSRHDLLLRAVVAARALSSQLGLQPTDRLALLLPNELEVPQWAVVIRVQSYLRLTNRSAAYYHPRASSYSLTLQPTRRHGRLRTADQRSPPHRLILRTADRCLDRGCEANGHRIPCRRRWLLRDGKQSAVRLQSSAATPQSTCSE